MSKILQLPVKQEEKIVLFPKVFTQIFEAYKKKQNDIRRRKIKFLENQAFQYFYDILPLPEIQVSKGIDIPMFVKEEQAERKRIELARDKASHAMLRVIADGRVDECYSKRIKQLKKLRKLQK